MFRLLHKVNLINSLQYSDHRFFFFCSKKMYTDTFDAHREVYTFDAHRQVVFDFEINCKPYFCLIYMLLCDNGVSLKFQNFLRI